MQLGGNISCLVRLWVWVCPGGNGAGLINALLRLMLRRRRRLFLLMLRPPCLHGDFEEDSDGDGGGDDQDLNIDVASWSLIENFCQQPTSTFSISFVFI